MPRASVAYLFMVILIHMWQKAIAYEHMFKYNSQANSLISYVEISVGLWKKQIS